MFYRASFEFDRFQFQESPKNAVLKAKKKRIFGIDSVRLDKNLLVDFNLFMEP